jgi:hypothetical protein
VGCGGGDSGTATAPAGGAETSSMAIKEDSAFHATVFVGKHTDFDMLVRNVGTVDIPNVAILFDDGGKFLDVYTV